MRRFHFSIKVILTALAMLGFVGVRTACDPRFIGTALESLPGDPVSQPFGINERGLAVGNSALSGLTIDAHPVFWEPGRNNPTPLPRLFPTLLPTLPGDSAGTAGSVNNLDQIVGETETASATAHAVIWENGVVTALATLSGGTTSVAHSINDKGQIAGKSDSADFLFIFHAVRWENSTATPTDLGTLGGNFSQGLAINENSQIIGDSITASGDDHAFLWTQGGTDGVTSNPQMKDLGTLGGTFSFANAINNEGQVAGVSTTSTGLFRAFLWTPGGTDGVSTNPQMKDLGTLGGDFSRADALNDKGQVGGSSKIAGFGNMIFHSFLWQDGVFTDLGTPPVHRGGFSQVHHINNAGQIVGASQVTPICCVNQRGYLLTPVRKSQ